MSEYVLIQNDSFLDGVFIHNSIDVDFIGLLDIILMLAKLKGLNIKFDIQNDFYKSVQIKEVETKRYFTVGFKIEDKKIHKVIVFSIQQDFKTIDVEGVRVSDFKNMLESKTQQGMIYCLEILKQYI